MTEFRTRSSVKITESQIGKSCNDTNVEAVPVATVSWSARLRLSEEASCRSGARGSRAHETSYTVAPINQWRRGAGLVTSQKPRCRSGGASDNNTSTTTAATENSVTRTSHNAEAKNETESCKWHRSAALQPL